MRTRRGMLEFFADGEPMIKACRRVLRTSNGFVTNAADMPLNAPEINATHAPLWPFRANAFLVVSYPAQYKPENGTSRQRVAPRPRHRNRTPLSRTRPRTELKTERRVFGLRGWEGVDWRFVRTSSSGDMIVVIVERARMPAESGTTALGRRGGRTTFNKWS
jgi:hypothetical protein